MQENQIPEKFLPVGTVVLLKNGKKRAMITGFCCIDQKDTTKVYDYTGCLYPEGTISSDKNLLFNHDQINKIYHLGLIDEEEKKFKEKLNGLVKQFNVIASKPNE